MCCFVKEEISSRFGGQSRGTPPPIDTPEEVSRGGLITVSERSCKGVYNTIVRLFVSPFTMTKIGVLLFLCHPSDHKWVVKSSFFSYGWDHHVPESDDIS